MENLVEPRFCYKVVGSESPSYVETYFDGGKKLPNGIYKSVHHNLKFTLSNELGVPPQYLICITPEEYEQHKQIEVS